MDTSLLRKRARDNLSGNWALSVAVCAVAALLGAMMAGTVFLPQLSVSEDISDLLEFDDILEEGIRLGRITFGFNNGIFGLAQFILGGVVQLGFAQYLLKQHDRQPFSFHDLFSQFDRFGQGFAQAFLRKLYTALWGLLFIIPGIIKSLSYAMTPYIMAENPDMTASEAINRSKEMMDGYKGDLFILHLTFIGWEILAAMTLNIGYLVLNPYKNAADAAFYRQLVAERQNGI